MGAEHRHIVCWSYSYKYNLYHAVSVITAWGKGLAEVCMYTDKKENKSFLIYKENQMDWVQNHIWGRASQYMRKLFPISEEAVSYIWFCTWSLLISLYMRKILFLFYKCMSMLYNLQRMADCCCCGVYLYIKNDYAEAEFLDVIGTKVLIVFLLAIHSHHF
jgi:hypothetical protein